MYINLWCLGIAPPIKDSEHVIKVQDKSEENRYINCI